MEARIQDARAVCHEAAMSDRLRSMLPYIEALTPGKEAVFPDKDWEPFKESRRGHGMINRFGADCRRLARICHPDGVVRCMHDKAKGELVCVRTA